MHVLHRCGYSLILLLMPQLNNIHLGYIHRARVEGDDLHDSLASLSTPDVEIINYNSHTLCKCVMQLSTC